jgi:leader peptidase (prepilin peptidase) / N-methyltransferase
VSLLPAVVGAVGCGAAGAVVPLLVRRLPEPPPDPELPPDEPAKVPYAELGGRPALLPVAVAVSAVAGGVLGLVLGWVWLLFLVWPLVPVGTLLGIVDWHTRLLPRVVVLPATLYAMGFGGARWAATGDPGELVRGLVALVAVRTLFWVLWFIRRAGMGFGDVRLAALLGCTLGYAGWSAVVVGLYAAFVLFAVPFLVLAIARRDRGVMKRQYPFGPFLLAGAWLGLLVGEPVAVALGY